MENQGLDYYKKRRLEKRKERQLKQVKQLGIIASLLTLGIVVSIILISKPSVAKMKSKSAAAKQDASLEATEKPVVMAAQGSIKLLLPIKQSQLTAIGFHEAFNPQSVSLQPKGTEVNAKKIKTRKRLFQIKEKLKGLMYSLMWRGSRSGPLNSSVDIGSKTGTLNYSPINGRVVQIRNYKLYGRYPDKEIHILPKGFNDRHLVVIHAGDIKVKTGDKIIAGVTPLGRTRALSTFFKQQLSDYSKEAGNHVHFQVNKLVNGKCHQD